MTTHKPTLVTVPPNATALDVLTQRHKAAWQKMKLGREQWIDGMLELAVIVAETRAQIPDHREYSRWLERNGLENIIPQDRSAFCMMAKDLPGSRILLEQTDRTSPQHIWANRPNKPQRTPSQLRKGTLRPVSPRNRRKHITGSQHRNRIPDVMREDNPPPAPKPRKKLHEMFLTREQIDPDFKGTALEFATKYGHVPLHTKTEIEHNKRQEALNVWLGAMHDHERSGRAMLVALAAVDPDAICRWLSKPGRADKLTAWCRSLQLAYEGACGQLNKAL